jgi:hypothetical protein|tara:strand:- start:117 stop:413 length:297 start_codon:yes stop_codon:yes gene_type:complete
MNAEDSVISYFKFKKIKNLGFLKYGNFRKIITYILDIHDNNYIIRKTFLNLVERGYFYRKQDSQKKSYKYKFNDEPIPSKKIDEYKEIIPETFIITFD